MELRTLSDGSHQHISPWTQNSGLLWRCMPACAGMEWVHKWCWRSCRISCQRHEDGGVTGLCAAVASLKTFKLFIGSCSFHVGFIDCCICYFQACVFVFSRSSLTDGSPSRTPSVTQWNEPFKWTVVFRVCLNTGPFISVLTSILALTLTKFSIVIKSCAFAPRTWRQHITELIFRGKQPLTRLKKAGKRQ